MEGGGVEVPTVKLGAYKIIYETIYLTYNNLKSSVLIMTICRQFRVWERVFVA